jgi:ASPIC and UnbV/Secretion system C-terminal sorting domain/FG-GAP-like repeat
MKNFSLTIFLLMLCNIANAQNTCATALPITAGVFSVGTINGTDIPNASCTINGATPIANNPAGEWYTYTPTANYFLTITTDLLINSGKDTRVIVYTGSCGALTCLNSDDDAGIIGNGYLSILSFNVTAGTTYHIAFDNRWNASGFECQIIEATPIVYPITFTSSTIPVGETICCVADMNNDYLDDIVTVQANQMTILTQKIVGGFNSAVMPLPAMTANPSWSICAGDFDRNGYNDLVFGGGSRLSVIKANATGTGYNEIAYPQNIFTQRTNFIDINNDGNLDLFACHDVDQSHVYRNDGAGNLIFDIAFMPTLAVGGNYQSQWSDIDNDGDQDMYMSKCRAGAAPNDEQRINLMYKNNGSGIFTETAALDGINDNAQSWSSAIEDFDNDGDMDIMLSNISDQNRLYKNNGNGTFSDIYDTTNIDPQIGSWEIQAADFNNDGWMDFLWQNGKELYLNNGDMTFNGVDLPFGKGGIGDLNNDGFLDVQYDNKVYYNNPNTNNWLTVNLKGVQSNINGIGARLEIYGAWGKQIREIKSGNGFSQQSTLNAHFGIGTATSITQLIIRWPSGKVDVIDNPTKNQTILVIEGSSPLAVNQFSNADFSVYPNPANDVLNIKFNENLNQFKSVQIFDLVGRVVLTDAILNQTINVKSLSKGTYVLIAKDNDGKQFSQKFIKE